MRGEHVRSTSDRTVLIEELPRHSIGTAARLLARAFASDPILTHFMNGRIRRSVAYSAFFRTILLDNWPYGFVYGAWLDGRLIGAAIWTPPNAAGVLPLSDWLRTANNTIVRVLFPVGSSRIVAGFAKLGPLHPQSEHWYLPFVGIDPVHQGHGVGARLLHPVLERADREGTLCYLETPFSATHAFYQRLGFELAPAIYPFSGAPPVWTMLRKPPRNSQ